MSGPKRIACYLGGTVVLVVLAFFVGVSTNDCDTGECDLAGIAGVVVAFWTLWACVLGIIVIEGVGAWRRVRTKRAAAEP